MALAMLYEGYLDNKDDGLVTQLLETGVARFSLAHLGRLQWLAPLQVVFSSNVDALEIDPSFYANGVSPSQEQSTLFVALDQHEASPVCVIGQALATLDAKHPGMGSTVMQSIETASQLMQFFTPSSLFDLGQLCSWYGLDTTADMAEEMQAMGCEDEDLECIEGPDEFLASLGPSWFSQPQKRLSGKRLNKLARRASDTRTRRVAALVSKLFSLTQSEHWQFPHPGLFLETDPVYGAGFIRYSNGDDMMRVVDDHIQMANQSGDCFTTIQSAWEVEATVSECRQWLQALRRGFHVYKCLDQLLEALVGPNEEKNHA